MSVAIAIGGSLGGLTAALKLKETYDTVYCLTGFENYTHRSNHGLTRGLRTVNLEREMLDIVVEGWDYWKSLGLHGDFLHSCIVHRFPHNIDYEFDERHKQLLTILDSISPRYNKRCSKQLNENTLYEDTGIYKLQEIIHELKLLCKKSGIILSPVHVIELYHTYDCVYVCAIDAENEKYELDCDRCVLCIGNMLKNLKSNMNVVMPLCIWNEFSYYTVPGLYNHDGIWTWGTKECNSNTIYNDRLGFYIMLESDETLKVAIDASHVVDNDCPENLEEYRQHKDKFVRKYLGLKYTNVRYENCYYAVSPFVQHSGPVSVINAGGYGYCVPGFVLRAIAKNDVPENKHYTCFCNTSNKQRHDLSTYE